MTSVAWIVCAIKVSSLADNWGNQLFSLQVRIHGAGSHQIQTVSENRRIIFGSLHA